MVLEGPTEETFVRHVLSPHLATKGVFPTWIIVETSRDTAGRKRTGGGSWAKWRRDLRLLLGQHPGNDVRFTTMFDFYGLPRDFPGLSSQPVGPDVNARVAHLEEAMKEALQDWRFLPNLVKHEFEALVFASLDSLEALATEQTQREGLVRLREVLKTREPEDVNDAKETSPSHRLEREFPGYQKTLHGPLCIEDAGLQKVRSQCPRFDAWVKKLEELA